MNLQKKKQYLLDEHFYFSVYYIESALLPSKFYAKVEQTLFAKEYNMRNICDLN